MKEKIANLIDLKSIITLLLGIGLTVGFFMGKIEEREFMTIVVMVFTYYFARKTKEEPTEEEIDLDLTGK